MECSVETSSVNGLYQLTFYLLFSLISVTRGPPVKHGSPLGLYCAVKGAVYRVCLLWAASSQWPIVGLESPFQVSLWIIPGALGVGTSVVTLNLKLYKANTRNTVTEPIWNAYSLPNILFIYSTHTHTHTEAANAFGLTPILLYK